MMLRQALSTMQVSELRLIAAENDLALPANVWKEHIIEGLVRHLTSPGAVKSLLAELSSAERAALDDLISNGGIMMARLFTREHGAFRYGGSFIYGARQSDQSATAAEGLARRGLIFRAFGTLDRWSGEIVMIAEDVLRVLPPVTRRSFDEIMATAAEPPAQQGAGDLIRDIGAFLCYLQRETARVVHIDRLSKRDLQKLNTELSLRYADLSSLRNEREAPYLEFVHYLTQLLGLIQVRGTVVAPSTRAEEWLAQPLDAQMSDAWQRFLKDGGWNDVTRSVQQQFVTMYPGDLQVAASRSRFMEALRRCPVDTWLSLPSLVEALRVHVPGLLRERERQAVSSPWFSDAFYGRWEDVESVYVEHVLSTWLSWFGVVQVGREEAAKKVTAFRITRLGAVLLGIDKGPIMASEPQPIVIQANFEIVVPFEAPGNVVFRLQQIADVSQRDRASIYKLSPASIWRNLQAGGNIEDVIAFLERSAQRALPQNVAYSLREWATKHGELTIEPAIVLLAANDALLAQLRSSKKLPLRVKHELSARAVTIEGDVPALVEQLTKAGFWPKVTGDLVREQRTKQSTSSSLAVRPGNLTGALAAAIVLRYIADQEGWEAPVDEATIRELSWGLTPTLAKQVDRLASEAIAQYEAFHRAGPGRRGYKGLFHS